MSNRSPRGPWWAAVALGVSLLALTLPRAAAAASPITPYVDDATLAVVRVDVDRLDFAAEMGWFRDMMKAAKMTPAEAAEFDKQVQQGLAKSKAWQADFAKAGGRSLYVVVRLNPQAPAYAVVPVAARADAKALTKVLQDYLGGLSGAGAGVPGGGMQGEVVGAAFYFGPAAALADAKAFTPADRPELEQAFAAAGDAPVRVAFNPNAGLRQLLAMQAPQLPPELGGGSIAAVSQGLRWATLTVEPPPKGTITLTIKGKDADAAAKLRAIFDAGAKSAPLPPGPVSQKLVAALTPAVAGDQLKVTLDTPKVSDLMMTLLPALNAARAQASRAVSANNLRQIVLAVHMYANENGDAMPKDLGKDLKKYLDDPTGHLWVNPADPTRRPGYVWRRPADKLSAIPAQTVLLYEAFDKWPGFVNAAFADGRIIGYDNEPEFRAALAGKVPAPPSPGR